ncbi:hypothetical protein OF83DRAFT_1175270 [Amylostereum chailletii]|nr:hypothetical protein OF83DRAFT_1175270 [Amylostereum chailletii]
MATLHLGKARVPDAPAPARLPFNSSFQFCTDRTLLPLLSTDYCVIAPNQPEFGFTEVPAERQYVYMFDGLSKTIEAFVDALGLTKFALYVFDYDWEYNPDCPMSVLDPPLGALLGNGLDLRSKMQPPTWASKGRQHIPILNGIIHTGRSNTYLVDYPEDGVVENDSAPRDIKARRNARRPLVRLPLELTAIIVFLIADIDPAIHYTGPGSSSKLGWIKITHVCQHIHNINEHGMSR